MTHRLEAFEVTPPLTTPPRPEEGEKQDETVAATGTTPPRPGQLEVDEDAVDRALERSLVQAGVLLLPFGKAEVQPSFTFLRREIEAPQGFRFANGTSFVGSQRLRRDTYTTSLTLRAGLPLDTQAEVNVPYQYARQSVVATEGFVPRAEFKENSSGLGDVSVNIAKTLFREKAWRPDLVMRVNWNSKSGDDKSGTLFGNSFNQITTSLSALKRLDPIAITARVGYDRVFESNGIAPGDRVITELGASLAVSPGTSLRLGINNQFISETEIDGEKVRGSDDVVSTLDLGGSTILGRGVLLDVSIIVGLTDRSPDFGMRVSLPVRFDLPIPGALR